MNGNLYHPSTKLWNGNVFIRVCQPWLSPLAMLKLVQLGWGRGVGVMYWLYGGEFEPSTGTHPSPMHIRQTRLKVKLREEKRLKTLPSRNLLQLMSQKVPIV